MPEIIRPEICHEVEDGLFICWDAVLDDYTDAERIAEELAAELMELLR